MSMHPSRSLLGLAALSLLAACTESRDLPSAPQLAAHGVAARRPNVPGAQGYPLLAYDPVKDHVWLVGGWRLAGCVRVKMRCDSHVTG